MSTRIRITYVRHDRIAGVCESTPGVSADSRSRLAGLSAGGT